MASFTQAIKTAAIDAVNAMDPANLLFANVIKATPIEIKIDQKLLLSGPAVVVLAGLELAAGDSVAVLKAQGGQRFLVLGKVVE